MIEGVANAIDSVHEFGNALEGEELALDGNENGIGGDQGIEGKEIQSRRTIDEDETVGVTDRAESLPKAKLALVEINELDVGSDEVFVGGNKVEAFEGRRCYGVGEVAVTEQRIV